MPLPIRRGVYLSAKFFERTRSFPCKMDATLGSTSAACDSFLYTGFSLYAEFFKKLGIEAKAERACPYRLRAPSVPKSVSTG